MSKKKLKAARKMSVGAAQMISGGLTASGKGILGGALNDRGLINSARILGRTSINAGKKRFEEGRQEWREADD